MREQEWAVGGHADAHEQGSTGLTVYDYYYSHSESRRRLVNGAAGDHGAKDTRLCIFAGSNISGAWVFATGLPLDVFNGAGCEEFGQGVVFGNCGAYFPANGQYESASVHNNNGVLSAYSSIPKFVAPDPEIFGRTGRGCFRGLNRWNVDFGISKTTKITERVSTRFDCQMTNVFNHVMFADPNTDLHSGSFGRLNNQYNQPRFIQFALRFDF